MSEQLVSIIIRSCNEQEHIGRLLTGIFEQSVKDVEVIVVDSGSTDNTISIASKFPVHIHEISPEDFTFGSSLNYGCNIATGQFIVIASAHVYPVYRDWLEKLIAPFRIVKTCLVYGKQQGNDESKYSERRMFHKWFPDESNYIQDHPFCNNANSAIRRSLWERLPYDETLTGLEDLDWARRAMKLGYKVVYETDAGVIHVHNESLNNIFNRYRREAIALKRMFPQDKFTMWDFVRLFVGNTSNDCYHAWHDKVFWFNLKEIILFRFIQFWGTYRGYSQRGPVTSQLRHAFYYPNGWSRCRPETAEPKQREKIEYPLGGREE